MTTDTEQWPQFAWVKPPRDGGTPKLCIRGKGGVLDRGDLVALEEAAREINEAHERELQEAARAARGSLRLRLACELLSQWLPMPRGDNSKRIEYALDLAEQLIAAEKARP